MQATSAGSVSRTAQPRVNPISCPTAWATVTVGCGGGGGAAGRRGGAGRGAQVGDQEGARQHRQREHAVVSPCGGGGGSLGIGCPQHPRQLLAHCRRDFITSMCVSQKRPAERPAV
jgi:hypothetical protein